MNYDQIFNEFVEIKKAFRENRITADDTNDFLSLIISQLLLLVNSDEIDELIFDIEQYRTTL